MFGRWRLRTCVRRFQNGNFVFIQVSVVLEIAGSVHKTYEESSSIISLDSLTLDQSLIVIVQTIIRVFLLCQMTMIPFTAQNFKS